MSYSAVEFRGNGHLVHVQKVLPAELGSHDVVVRIEAGTICGTDLHILKGDHYAKPPVVLCHEFSGYVERIGKEVHSLAVGDLVTVEPHIFCGTCKFCRIGKEHLCLEKLAFGVHLDGGFAQYCVVPDKTVYKVPEGISASVAALTENIGCCLHGMDRVNVKLGDHVVILGGGFVGIILAELSRMSGAAKVIVSEPNEMRRNVLESRGFITVNPLKDNLSDFVLQTTNQLGADVVIEAAGLSATAKQAFELVGRCGTIMFFGVVPPTQSIEVAPNDIFKRELTIIGSAINPYSHHRSIELLPLLRLEELVTHHFALDEIEKAFETARKGNAIKVAIHPNGGSR